MLRCYSRTTRSVGGWCWTKSGAKIKLLTFLRLCSIGLFPVYPARTKTLHCYLRRTKGSLVLEMRCILHRENSLQRERVFETVLRSGVKSFSMLRTGQSLGHLGTSGGAEHTLVPCSGLHFLLSRAVMGGSRHWPSCREGGGGRAPRETTSRQVTAGQAPS